MKLAKSFIAWVLAITLVLLSLPMNTMQVAADYDWYGNWILEWDENQPLHEVQTGDHLGADGPLSLQIMDGKTTEVYNPESMEELYASDAYIIPDITTDTEYAALYAAVQNDIYDSVTNWIAEQDHTFDRVLSASSVETAYMFKLYPARSGEVQSSAPSGYVYENTEITLSANDGEGILYTVDGTTPTKDNGTVYSGPINITAGQTIMARTFESGSLLGDVLTVSYPKATGVVVTPETPTVAHGNEQQFTAEVSGQEGVSQSVVWTVEGNNSQDTTISNTGKLLVAADETASTLAVKATYTYDATKYGSTNVTIPTEPMLKGYYGWTMIRDILSELQDGEDVTIYMNGDTVVPESIWEAIKGKNITVNFDMGNDILWKVKGAEITTDTLQDMNLSTILNVNVIPQDMLDSIEGADSVISLSIAFNGEFGFPLTLKINVGQDNAGKKLSLFYYNKDDDKLEYQQTVTIGEEGVSEITYTHASDYAMAIANKDLNPAIAPTPTAKPTATAKPTESPDSDEDTSPNTGDQTSIVWLFALMLGSAAGFGVLKMYRKEK